MSEAELRLDCLKIAMELGGTVEEILTNAAKLFAFILGEALPSSRS